MENDAKSITNEVTISPHVHIDETSYSLDGDLVWILALMHKNTVAMIMNKSRGVYVMDSYMDK